MILAPSINVPFLASGITTLLQIVSPNVLMANVGANVFRDCKSFAFAFAIPSHKDPFYMPFRGMRRK